MIPLWPYEVVSACSLFSPASGCILNSEIWPDSGSKGLSSLVPGASALSSWLGPVVWLVPAALSSLLSIVSSDIYIWLEITPVGLAWWVLWILGPQSSSPPLHESVVE